MPARDGPRLMDHGEAGPGSRSTIRYIHRCRERSRGRAMEIAVVTYKVLACNDAEKLTKMLKICSISVYFLGIFMLEPA